MRYKRLVSAMLLTLLFLAPLTTIFGQGDATTEERTVVTYGRRGPMHGLRQLDKIDPRLVYELEDARGNKIDPTKVRELKENPLYLPKGVKLDLAKYRKFLATELRTYGRPRQLVHRHRRNIRHGSNVAKHKRHQTSVTAAILPKVPVVELLGPEHITLKPGDTQTVAFTVKVDGKEIAKRTLNVAAEKPQEEKTTVPTGLLVGFQTNIPWLRTIAIYILWIVLVVLLIILLLQLRAWRRAKEQREIPPIPNPNPRNFDKKAGQTVTTETKVTEVKVTEEGQSPQPA